LPKTYRPPGQIRPASLYQYVCQSRATSALLIRPASPDSPRMSRSAPRDYFVTPEPHQPHKSTSIVQIRPASLYQYMFQSKAKSAPQIHPACPGPPRKPISIFLSLQSHISPAKTPRMSRFAPQAYIKSKDKSAPQLDPPRKSRSAPQIRPADPPRRPTSIFRLIGNFLPVLNH